MENLTREKQIATSPCPLCLLGATRAMRSSTTRPYVQCLECAFIFVPPEAHLSSDAEKSRYLEHQNSPHDQNYRKFLSRLALPLLKRLSPGQQGLDFGSGPGPALSHILEEAGMEMQNYDPFFAPQIECLHRQYDFITATETLEHLREPHLELDRLAGMLKSGGILAVMTEMLQPAQKFSEWYYQRDPTHIGFFQEKSMKWIARQWNWGLEFPHRNVTFFINP